MTSLADAAPFGWIIGSAIGLASLYIGFRERRSSRIRRFVSNYLAFIEEFPSSNPLKPLKPCGVLELKDNGEVREAFQRIQQRGRTNPIAFLPPDLEGRDIHLFLRAADKHGFDITDIGRLFAFLMSEVCPIYQVRHGNSDETPPNKV